MGVRRSSLTAFRHLVAQDQMYPRSGGRESTQPWLVLVCVLRMRTSTGSHGCTASRVRWCFTGLREQEGRPGGWLPRQHRTSCGGAVSDLSSPDAFSRQDLGRSARLEKWSSGVGRLMQGLREGLGVCRSGRAADRIRVRLLFARLLGQSPTAILKDRRARHCARPVRASESDPRARPSALSFCRHGKPRHIESGTPSRVGEPGRR